jgi:hypothetical protein
MQDRRWLVVVAVLALAAAIPLAVHPVDSAPTGQEPPPEMAPFERLIGGRWHLGDDSYQTFSWGVGRLSVKAEMYFAGPAGPELVSEMTWYWHPGRATLVAHGVAIGMGIDFFQVTTRWEGDTMINDLEVWGPQAPPEPQREHWTFTDDDHYEWTLYSEREGTWVRTMGGSWERR